LEEVAVYASHKVLVEVEDNMSLIVADPRRILDQQLRPHQSHKINIIITLKYKLFF
jgi:hypothetical protein